MATYAIGDIQGCYQPFLALLEKINFDPNFDKLWLAGDLINRGPETLATLRHIVELDRNYSCINAVLGNHDLHFLAVAKGHKRAGRGDTLNELLSAPDCDDLIDWLRQRPLVYTDKNLGFTMVHAGIPPQWTISQALEYSSEVEKVLTGNKLNDFLSQMYGNQPCLWSNDLTGFERLRVITNYFTRMRFCDAEGRLELENKSSADQAPTGYLPWFCHPHRATRNEAIVFGHWAALEGKTDGGDNIFALDTGCIWGGNLTAMCLEDRTLFQVSGSSKV